MKTVDFEHASLDTCIQDAQEERVLVTRGGKPVALVVGIGGLDDDQLALANSTKFWSLIDERRQQKTLNRAELEEKIEDRTAPEGS